MTREHDVFQAINGGSASVKDIFRCVWCHERYASLADLTQHLKEANHSAAAAAADTQMQTQGRKRFSTRRNASVCSYSYSRSFTVCSPHSQMSIILPASVFSEWRISFKDADPSQVLTDPDSGGQEVADDHDPGTSPDSAIRSFEVSSQTYFILPFSELW